jgi:hypothetical protein
MRNKAGKSEGAESSVEKISLYRALTDVDYRSATWVSIYINIAFNISGVVFINIYTLKVFKDIVKNGGKLIATPADIVPYIGFSNVLGCILSKFTIGYFLRRTIFIGGLIIMAIFLILFAISIHINSMLMAIIFSCSSILCF